MIKIITHVLLLVVLSSCASKKDLNQKVLILFDDYKKAIAESEVYRAAHEKPQLPKKFALAVHFKKPYSKTKSKQVWDWTNKDKELVISAFENNPNIGRTFELIKTEKIVDIRSLRLMAAQQGADALLEVEGLSDFRSDLNPSAISYLIILPVFFVNGNTVHGEFTIQAVLWNVERPFIHMGAQGDGDWEYKRPLAFRQPKRAIDKAKEESLNILHEKLKKQLSLIL